MLEFGNLRLLQENIVEQFHHERTTLDSFRKLLDGGGVRRAGAVPSMGDPVEPLQKRLMNSLGGGEPAVVERWDLCLRRHFFLFLSAK